jgi:flagellar biosynthetic protein FliP
MSRVAKAGWTVALAALVAALVVAWAAPALAQGLQVPNVDISIGGGAEGPEGVSSALQILALLTVLSLAPAILVMVTSFTRIIVVLAFVRNALATQQMPPNQVLVGLALFLTFFVMAPTFREVNEQALQPYFAGQIAQDEAYQRGVAPLRTFMFRQTREKDLALFVRMADIERPRTYRDIPTWVLVPAFVISELKTAFQIGFVIFIPFLVIDMVVSSALMSMGMLMLPPMMISLPFKILLFILVDGWNLTINSLIMSFR